jgi:hypothetical protein
VKEYKKYKFKCRNCEKVYFEELSSPPSGDFVGLCEGCARITPYEWSIITWKESIEDYAERTRDYI